MLPAFARRTRLVLGVAVVAAAVAAAPPGFSLTWSDDFNGAANAGIDTNVWKYDTGPGSSFGTGEIETMTSSTANVHHDGGGHLLLTAPPSGCSAPRCAAAYRGRARARST